MPVNTFVTTRLPAARRDASRRVIRRLALPVTIALVAALTPITAPAASAAGPCTAPVTSPIACENSLPGTPESDWQVPGSGDAAIQGYGTSMSVNVGQTITFKVKSSAKYHIDILRLGFYQGLGARKVAAGIIPTAAQPQSQPACLVTSGTGLIDCGNWGVSASWAVPSTSVSGVYLAHLVRDDTGGGSVIPFVVRNDASASKLLFQTADETWQAYNSYGGNSLYKCTVSCPAGTPQAYKGASKVSYNRPFHTADDDLGRSWLMYSEVPMIRFLEANGYDVSYTSGLDVATRGSLLVNHKTFLSVGHDEYWSLDQRASVEAALAQGVNLAFLSGNEMFWRTRWEPSADGTNTPGRTLVAYKDTHYDMPKDPVTWTGTWRDPRFGTATGAGNPENGLTGQFFLVNSGTKDIEVPAAYGKLRLWRNTAAASLSAGQTLTVGHGVGTLGYEWDVDSDNGFRPAGQIKLSATTNPTAEVFTDYGSNTAIGTATHNLTMYKAPSGALVFGAGTVQWSWGLDNFTTGDVTDKNLRQATVNLFADMGAQPATPESDLAVATASSDTTPPSSSISSPVDGTSLTDGAKITISGTASDVGGVLGGVEVSTDGGASWHPATGTSNWTYTWLAHGSPTSVIKARAMDDSGNIEATPPSVTVNIPCPCSVYGTNALPPGPLQVDSGDGHSVELGVKFKADVAGSVSAVRFYKSTANKGTHVGNLWTASGQLLATGTFASETATGWQTLTFTKPVAVSANTTYVASYFAPNGHYSQEEDYFYLHPASAPAGNNSVDSAPLHFLRTTTASPNGLYGYLNNSGFPTSTYRAEYYWVDVVFSPSASATPTVTSTSPASAATSVAPGASVSATLSQAVTPSSVVFTLKDASNATVPAAQTYTSATNTATLTPTAALAYNTTYTASISGATNSTGQTMSPYSWSFTTAATPVSPTVTSTSPTSGATDSAPDTAVKATFDQAVTPSSVVFTLKDAANTTVPATQSYASATNTATLTPSSALANNTTYTASISGATNSTGQTMAPYNWSFTTASAPASPQVASTVPASAATGIATTSTVSAAFDQAVTPSSVVFTLKDAANTTVPATQSYASATNTATLTPTSALAYNTTYTASISGATNSTGQTMAPYSWSFTTAATPASPTVTSTSPASAATGVAPTSAVSATFSQAVTPSSVIFTLKDAASAAVPATQGYTSATNTATLTPTSALAYNTTYTANISGATNSTGQTMAPYSWSFTTAAAPACPCSLFAASSAPASIGLNDGQSLELGMKFRSDLAGTITGVRYYKSSQDAGSHTGHLWSSTGTLLSSVTFAGGAASGWQQATFATPVTVTANTTYVVSYFSSAGYYNATGGYFATGKDNGSLHGLADGVDGGNGVYRYGTTAFPSNTWNSTNYWVDVVFNTSSASATPTVTLTSPASAATGVAPSAAASATFDQAVTPSSVVFTLKDAANTTVPGTQTYTSATNTATLTPTTALAYNTTYTASVSGATNSAGKTMAPYSWSFTTAAVPAACPCSLFSASSAPASTGLSDGQSLELGMKFRSDVAGTITGVRYYRSSQDTGTHTGHLWSSTGTLLSSVTFTGGTASGWQQATFATPVTITANTTYVVSDFSSAGYYSATGGYFATGKDNGSLHGLADGIDGGNGVYQYGTTGFPTNTWNSTNYWIDVVFNTQ